MYDKILKSIEDEIRKCTVSLKSIRSQISEVIRSVADDDGEYELLLDVVSRFYQSHYNLDHECMYLQDYDGLEYENENGSEGRVDVPSNAVDVGVYGYGMWLSIHNHPNFGRIKSSSFLSYGDFIAQLNMNEKYCIVVADEGVSLCKYGANLDKDFNVKMGAKDIYADYTDKKEEMVQSTAEYGVIRENFLNGEITLEEADNEGTVMLHNYYNEHIDGEMEVLNRSFKKAHLPFEFYHIPIKR